jgi:hypothetical protein
MNRPSDPWAGEKMSRSDAQRRYQNLVTYQLRPMITIKKMSDDNRIQAIKRIIREASRFRYESGVVPQSGIREEVTDLCAPYFKLGAETSEELAGWLIRMMRSFGCNPTTED